MKAKQKSSGAKIAVTTKREVYTYVEMWTTSRYLLEKGQQEQRASTHQFRASLAFTAFTMEAYLNHVGQRLFECWDDLERLGPKEKLNLIAEHLGVAVNFGERPWQIMKDLFSFRNDIAHGKSQRLTPPVKITSFEEHMSTWSFYRTRWEEFGTQDNAEKARANVERIVHVLYEAAKAAGHDTGHPFVPGSQSGSGTLYYEDEPERRSSKKR